MRGSSLLPVVLAVVLASGCATAVDMDVMNSHIDDNTRRIEALERAQDRQKTEARSDTAKRLESLQDEVDSLQKDLADSKWTVREMTEKVESFKAFMGEVEQFMAQYRKKGGEVDKALEQITNRLEADIRSLADKLRQMLDSGPGN
jgi:chromosome segregation ATPase